jgi:hypothetical protein
MKKTFLALAALALLTGTAEAKRTHVRIHKQPPVAATQPVAVPLAVIPVVGVIYDIARRTDCRGDVLGAGGAGFDPQPKTGNFLIPATQRSVCAAAPKSY